MITQSDVLSVLHGVVHPESGSDLVTLGMVEGVNVSEEKISLTLTFARARDPFAGSLKKQCEAALTAAYPAYAGKIAVFIKEAVPKATTASPAASGETPSKNLSGIKNIIAVSSTKGGVGKSTVTAHLALELTRMNYRVGILDADLYGPSQPILFGLEHYRPAGEEVDGEARIYPAEVGGIKVMSIGFFIDPGSPLIWRGPMATTALKQMIHQCWWGDLDFLLVDLPPGTGDVHITLISELAVTAALVVTTPQKLATADVVRGIGMFRNDKVAIPILGLIENMSWFTPAELPENRYYLFGKGGGKALAKRQEIKLLGEIPLVLAAGESPEEKPVTEQENLAAAYYEDIAGNMIHQLNKVTQKNK